MTRNRFSFVLNSNNSTSHGTKVLFRKCCGLGQVYYDNSTLTHHSVQCVDYSNFNHSLLNLNPQNLFMTADQNPFEYDNEDFEFVTGLPSNCNELDLLVFSPDLKMDERFYLTGSGQMIFHHKFYYLNFPNYCVEEKILEEDFTKVS